METSNKVYPEWDEVKTCLSTNFTLYFLDRNDSLNNVKGSTLQEYISNNGYDVELISFDEPADITYELKDCAERISSKFPVFENDLDFIQKHYEDNLRDWIYDHDTSTVETDLLKERQTLYYDLGVDVNDPFSRTKDDLKNIKKRLKILIKDPKHDKLLNELLDNASYGGRLVIYFYEDVFDTITWDTENDFKSITFGPNIHLAIINECNGSGHDVPITLNRDLTIAFERERLILCRSIKYSYTFEVCGMTSDWCTGTQVKFNKNVEPKLKEIPLSDTVLKQHNKDKEYQKTFDAGGCTFGDINYSRHRKTTYINSFPCGNKCVSCGQFWID